MTAETAFEIFKANLWDDKGNAIRTTWAEVSALAGLTCTVLFGGTPFFLLSMVANIPLVVVATTRLALALACDIILILTRAFGEAAAKSITKPEKRDVENAAVAYRLHCREVHTRVKELLSGPGRCFQKGRVEAGLTTIIEDFKCRVLKGVGVQLPPNFRRDYTSAGSSSTSVDDLEN